TIPPRITSIGVGTFQNTGIIGITIPSSVKSIGQSAFGSCASLTSIMFEGTIASGEFDSSAFGDSRYSNTYIGDLRAKYLAAGAGTYTRPNGSSKTWTKQ
ncbi:leucine-rich repeat protein, partial [Treponema sp. R80B11-R83G3]